MIIASLPNRSTNPYLRLFYSALGEYGVERHPDAWFSLRWLWGQRNAVHAVHFHWPEQLWNGVREPTARSLCKLLAFLSMARALGVRVIWTAHNVQPHEPTFGADTLGLRIIGRFADLVICHDAAARDTVRRRHRPRGRVVVMPHGNYDGVYPAPRPAALVRQEWGLDPRKPVVACVGHLRSYKGFDVACEAAARLGDEAQVLIAGAPHPTFDPAPLAERVAGLPNAVLVQRRLTDRDYADLVNASDLVLLPYHRVTGSGALLAAWSLGKPVVASDLGYFRSMVPEGGYAGALFRTNDAGACASAVRRILRIDPQERERAARAEAARYPWAQCVRPVADALVATRTREAVFEQAT